MPPAGEQGIDDLFGSDSEADEQQHDSPPPAPQAVGLQGEGYEGLDDDVDDEDQDQQQTGKQPADNKHLFGSDEESEEDNNREQSPAAGGARSNRLHAAPRGPPMEVDAALMPHPAPGSICLMRTTNIIGIQPTAFDPATYEREDETFVDESGRHRVKLAHNAVIRWRTRRLPDGREVQESNARFVRWEDGTTQLLLGDEVLDVAEQDISQNNTYLFVIGGAIQGQAHLSTKLALRPASLDSGLHKRLREAVDKRHGKVYKVARHGGLQNPELDKARREAAEDERIKEREALTRKQEKVMSRAYGGARSRPARLTNSYLGEEQEWEADAGDAGGYEYDDGLTAAQRARLSLSHLSRNRALTDEGAEAEASRRLQAAKRGGGGPGGPAAAERGGSAGGRRRRVAGSDEEDEEEEEEEEEEDEEDEPEYESSGAEDDDEEEEDTRPSKKTKGGSAPAPAPVPSNKAKARRGVVLSDDEDD